MYTEPRDLEPAPYRIIRETDGIRHVTRIYYNGSTSKVSFWWKDRPEKPARSEWFTDLDDARRYADQCNHDAWKSDARHMFSY